MKEKSLARANPFLSGEKAADRRVRSLASSTAIETGESIAKLEQRVIRLQRTKHRIKLA